ncbi:bifunctional riboflavin kinase/FAD synthetase [Salinispirillum sp. LH 10-3-1]|uniref:Riboflavin biosynthesis protein n=1 Tax=Salinispirillum sp. LH 10-3-1 TaxID=2952525 RepID=A0AB38YHN3_9GAMM
MKLLRGSQSGSRPQQSTVVTVGNFDGVHLGHQQLLSALRDYGFKHQLETAVVLFEPQPKEYFLGTEAPPRLSSLREKLTLLKAFGIDWVWVVRFNQAFAAQTPEAFIDRYLVEGLKARHVVVGDDFRFGSQRRGDLALLQAVGRDHQFSAEGTGSFVAADQRVSSTAIRDALLAGDMALAESLLGRPYSLAGRVIHGQQLGRKLGFPTANIGLGRYRRAVNGVYSVWVQIGERAERLPGVANVGVKPSFSHLAPLLEVHLLDQSIDLYGQVLNVEFVEKIRDARKFDTLADLQAHIQKDTETARAQLARQRNE